MPTFVDRVRRKMAVAEGTEKARQLLKLQATIDEQAKKLVADKLVAEGAAILTAPSGKVTVVKRAEGVPGSPSVFRSGSVPETTIMPVASPKKRGATPRRRRRRPPFAPGRPTHRPLPAPLAAAAAAAPGTVPAIIAKRGFKAKTVLFPMLLRRLGGGRNAWIMEHIITVFVQGDLPAFEKGLGAAGFDKPEIDEVLKNLGEKTNNAADAFDIPLPAGPVAVKEEIIKAGPINHILFGGERNFTEEARQRRRKEALEERQEIAAADPSRRPDPVGDVRDLLDDESPISMF